MTAPGTERVLQAGLPEGSDAAQADTSEMIGELSGTVDRITEVRSASDLFRLAGEFRADLVVFALDLVVALIVMAVFFGLWHLVAAGLRPAFQGARLSEDVAGLLMAITKYTVLGFGLLVALAQIGFNVTGILAGLGVAGLALGFAAKDTLANFIAGVTIMWDRPFRVGDRVEVDGEFGQVKEITLRSTRIHTPNNRVVIIPNQGVVNNKIVNHTKQSSLRLDVPFGIAYREDIDAARRAVLTVVEDDDRVRDRPAPEVVVTEMAESSVNFELRLWLKNPHEEIPLNLVYTEAIKRALDGAGISIPYPHLSLFVEKMPEASKEDGKTEDGEGSGPDGEEP